MEKELNGAGPSDYMRRPERKTFWENLALGIWDAEESKFLGRTKRMWGIVSIFYTIFYAVLAGLFAICMYGLMATIDEKAPKYTLGSSLIGTNPGVGFRPLSKREVEGSLVWYNAMNITDTLKWFENINEFLKEYHDKKLLPKGGAKQVICDYNKYPRPGEVCAVDMSGFGNCTSANKYGYIHSAPCFFIKLNKIYDWEPEFYNGTSPDEVFTDLKEHNASLAAGPELYGKKPDYENVIENLPKEMPEDLKQHIAFLPAAQRNQIWMTCDGDDPADREAMGEVVYAPGRGLPGYYYPYTNEPGYLSPLISVQFLRPTISRIVRIECRAWAKNIIYHKSVKEPKGSVRFQFMIDHDVNYVVRQ